jgi:hypothetical protein
MQRELETLRRRYRPDTIRLLFIGESPPASGRFFYQADSGLYRAMCDAFSVFDPSINDANFLEAFKAAGCYLTDLCSSPVDRLPAAERRAVCRAAEPSLTRQLAQFRPQAAATVVRSIEQNVNRAVLAANWQGPFLRLPYPGRWSRHRKAFVEELGKQLRDLI